MRKMEKMISAMLVICMVFSMLPMDALAGETNAEQSVDGRILLDSSWDQETVWIDGVAYAVQGSGDNRYVDLPAEAEPGSMVTYNYHMGDSADVHTQYPVGMRVWTLNENEDGSYTPEEVEELENILQYSGSSIRITGKKGIRMITSIDKNKKEELTDAGLGGYTLLEYGTVLAWSSDLEGNKPLVLGQEYAKHNYAYKKRVADPVFKYEGNLMQYTNVLVGFTLDQCKEDISMRSYMILENENGEQMTIYGGTVQRSIGYIAWQNRSAFRTGTAAYNYVWEIIRHVYAEVAFKTNGGSAVESVFVQKGGSVEMPAAPEKEGYVFAGWYKDEALTESFDFTAAVEESVTLYAKWSLAGDLSVTVTSSDYDPTTKSIITPNDTITLTGIVTGEKEIEKIDITYSSYYHENAAASVNGISQWSSQIPLEIGTNAVTVTAYATNGAIGQTTVYINRTSEAIQYKDTVKIADEEDYGTIYEEIVGCWCDDNGTEAAADDTIVMLVVEDALLLEQIEDELLKPGDMYMVPENDLFVVGFSGVYKFHRAPEGCEDYPAEEYPDSQYEEIVFDYPGFSDLFGEEVSLDFSAGVNVDDPIAFAMGGNGMPLSLNGSAPMAAMDDMYGEPGWQTEELLTAILPSVNFSVDDNGRLNLGLKWDDVVVYDDDGKKNPSSGADKDKGQLKLSGEFGITNLKYTGGMQWHPSLAPGDTELLPQQMISKLEYTLDGELDLKGGATAQTSDLIKEINRYRNEEEFWGMKVNGGETFNNKLILCVVGVNLAPVSVKTYKTIKGLAATSAMTTPKLFLYFFWDADGQVTVEGSLGLKYSVDAVKGFNVQKNGYTGSYGSQAQNRSDKHYAIGSTHTLDVYDTTDDNGGLNLKLSGKIEASLDTGSGVGAGIMICGICPATIDGELFYRVRGEAEGEIQFLPEAEADGYASLYHGIGAQTDLCARAILKTKIGDTGIEANKHFEHMLWEEDLSTAKVDGIVYVAGGDGENGDNAVISGATVTLTKKDTGETWTATTDSNGKYTFGGIPCGEYSMVVKMEGFGTYINRRVNFEKKKTLNVFLIERIPGTFTILCDTVENGCVGLPITWSVFDVMPGYESESQFVYTVNLNGEPVFTSEPTAETSFSYTPTEGGMYSLSVELRNEQTTQTVEAEEEIPVADKLLLGLFEQDNDKTSTEPLEWRILTVEDGKALVITEHILTRGSYFNPEWIKYKYTYWAHSCIAATRSWNYWGSSPESPDRWFGNLTPESVPLGWYAERGPETELFYLHARYWCNEVFYKESFSDEERSRILLSDLTNPDNPTYGTEGGPDTQDYVFFLSLDEITTYLPTEKDRKATFTTYCANLPVEYGERDPYYWLRTPGKFGVNAMYVLAERGSIEYYGSDVGHSMVGYRPAMWITIGG